MDINQIAKLAEIMEKKRLTLVEVTENGSSIKLEREPEKAGNVEKTVPSAIQADQILNTPGNIAIDNAKAIKAPMVGVFYSSSTPEDKPFVSVGSVVKKGDVLCIIEAMKLMNEITSEADGEIAEVCAVNGQVVEYGQTLFKVK
jgi:acetyl-CoA carboxylase biotin carboxyl carrier protein